METTGKKRLRRCGEAAWLLGTLLLGLATALMARADLGLGMVVAPAYVLAEWAGISSGTACYVKDGILVLAVCIITGRIRLSYLFSFLAAVAFGLAVDLFTPLAALLPNGSLAARIGIYMIALPINTLSIALFFYSYLPMQAPELLVKVITERFGWKLYLVKYAHDFISCALAIVLSLLLLDRLAYVGVGTIVCTVLNGSLIAFFSRLLERSTDFDPLFPRLYDFLQKI